MENSREYSSELIAEPPVWVADPVALERLQTVLAQEPVIAVDTESDSLFSYFEKVCLLQFSTPSQDYLVDPLAVDISPLGPLFADPGPEKLFHAAEYDILCLKRDYHFRFRHIFDTMIAARVLGWKNVGLGNILQERFGITLNKKMQRADWGHRPLSPEHLAYAREDTHYLIALRDLQLAELERLGRLEEAREEFERLTRVEPTPRRFDPDAYWNIPGARDLDPTRLGILRELYRLRDAQARKEDRPPFKVLPDSTLMHLSEARPDSLRELQRIHGLSPFILQRYGEAVLRAVARGRASPQEHPPRPHARGGVPLDPAARTRLAHLKEWRKKRAAERQVEPDVIVSNDVLFAIARTNPHTLDALVASSHLSPWKTQEYAADLLAALHDRHK
ncbi:MAG: ribonuclease D [Chloroflexi bacterium]|nr:ribonuclease D [Chloroflexota bacterium]